MVFPTPLGPYKMQADPASSATSKSVSVLYLRLNRSRYSDTSAGPGEKSSIGFTGIYLELIGSTAGFRHMAETSYSISSDVRYIY